MKKLKTFLKRLFWKRKKAPDMINIKYHVGSFPLEWIKDN
jgi:hypothetical protein